MTQVEKAKAFGALHVKGAPLILYNIWDAGSAAAVANAGAPAVATGSASVAASQGYKDAEAIPMDLLFPIVARIAEAVDVPVSVDFEGAYAEDPDIVGQNVANLIRTGAIGLNFEDQVIGGEGLHGTDLQVMRIRAIRAAGDAAGVPIWINARTDLFLKDRDEADHAGLISPARDRAAAYAEAGANSFFAPWLKEPDLIEKLCAEAVLPVNIMWRDGVPSPAELGTLGVARVSYGPGPYRIAMAELAAKARALI
ncbi:MAG: isocitrate lyase/phosphoenolpyruvate mutase family protein [Pseudomonadota bacterium]